MYSGMTVIEDFSNWNEFYGKDKKLEVSDLPPGEYFPNMGLVLKYNGAKQHALLKFDKEGDRYLSPAKGYYPCKIKPANTEQTLALEMLRDDTVPLVTLFGAAGSGKTFLACAHMLHCLAKGSTSKIIIAKNLTPVGREIGYLPGSLEEKVVPFLGPFYDNFLKLGKSKYEIEENIQLGKMEISPLTFIQGRSISNAILCIDEIQNSLNMDIVKQIITRAGDNCKVILLGDPSQRFEKGELDLSYLIEKGKTSSLVSHLSMRKSVRSPLANWAVENL